MSSTASRKPSTRAKSLILTHDEKHVVVPFPLSYEAALEAARKCFPNLKADVVLETKDLEASQGCLVEISPESWSAISESLKSVSIRESETPPTQDDDGKVLLRFQQGSRMTLTRRMKRTTPFSRVFTGVTKAMGLASPTPPTFTFEGNSLERHQTPANLDMKDGDTIRVTPSSTSSGVKAPHRKPVLYLFSPTDIDVTVTLTLDSEWSLSIVYPIVQIKVLESTKDNQVQWNVRTHRDSSLTMRDTSLDVSYLFWEAEPRERMPLARPDHSSEHFSPLTCNLNDSNSVVLSIHGITTYLDAALKVLGLHTEARTSFITFWLPYMQKHDYIALRFVSQDSYSRAARLDIVPQPDVITRVFMLFQGVPRGDIVYWVNAVTHTTEDVQRWKRVVGVDVEKAADERLFRVLEWGGMELV